MSDTAFYPLFPEAVQMAPKVARKVVHHAAQAKPAALAVIQGFSMITLIISNAVSAAIGAGIAWYVSHRGMQGVKTDLNNAKNEIEKLKTSVTAPAV